ncbi:Hypothetical predicted protein [Lecanosticta acicola]|uniref:GPI anchored protein n=1 Tax=Lecanosticta acicola TaxID=111012 RepID=A0AAI8Z561_9PEZI|nr:Hypothetical predicted protein [Lecanosticta acicola]
MATSTILSLLALSSYAMAQQQGSSTVLTLPFYGYDSVSLVASVVSANKDATTLALSCAPIYSTADSDCGLFPYQTLTIGPSTYNMYMSDEGFTGTQACQTSASPVTCSESAAGSSANFPGSSTTTYGGTDVTSFAVTVTGGVEKLGGAAAAAATTTSGGSSVATGTAASTGAAATTLSGTAKATTTSTATASGSHGSASSGSATGSSTSSAAAVHSSGAAVVNGVSGGIVAAVAGGLGLLAW